MFPIPNSKMTDAAYTRLGVVLAVLVSFMLGAVSVTVLSKITKTTVQEQTNAK